jgi:hypothetical protein
MKTTEQAARSEQETLTILAAVPLVVTYQDGTTEEIKVRKIPMRA